MTLTEELMWRGFCNQTTYKDINVLNTNPTSFYWGVDPSANSMQVGNLAAAMMARVFMKHGHKAVLLIGGATGMIGDPDGKAQERDLLTLDQIEINKNAITRQYKQVFGGMDFKVVDNYDWFKNIGYLEFLRNVGKHVPMRMMLGREFVQSRLSDDGAGISYAEFSYSLIQGYDFLHLYNEHDVRLQLCGADQWGNSIAGVDLIRRINGGESHIWSCPLIINKSTGKKFGKTEDGAVWLDDTKTPVFRFYQFWINADDAGVEDYLKIYTDLDKATIDDIIESHKDSKSERLAQKHLAYEVTSIVHGEQRAKSVRKISDVLFGSENYNSLNAQDFLELKKELSSHLVNENDDLAEIIVACNLASSKTEARRFLESSAIYINGSQLPLLKKEINSSDFIDGFAVLKRGKNQIALLELE